MRVGIIITMEPKKMGLLDWSTSSYGRGDAMEGDWYMDGKKTSGNMYETYYKKYHANATWYSFAQSSNNNLIRKELSNTKQKLGM